MNFREGTLVDRNEAVRKTENVAGNKDVECVEVEQMCLKYSLIQF